MCIPNHWILPLFICLGAFYPERASDGRDGAGDQHDRDNDQAQHPYVQYTRVSKFMFKDGPDILSDWSYGWLNI